MYLDTNNVRAAISDNGVFFKDYESIGSAYEIPKNDGNNVSYSTSLWFSALDDTNGIHVAAMKYEEGNDFFSGPIADDYNSTFYTDNYASAIWKVSRAQINYHTANWTSTGYTPDPAITNWPANGNTSEGIAEQLAPFIDNNNNGIYEPLLGEHPFIQGSQCVYVILNDDAGIHTETGGLKLGIEIHLAFYQATSLDDIDNTTFLSVKTYNRSNNDYHGFRTGIWMDADIGQANNDFTGSDSIRNVAYFYNGENTDSQYGNYPPAYGFQFLSEPLNNFIYHNVFGGPTGDPNNATDYFRYMNAIWQNGQHMMYGGNGFNIVSGGISNYFFSGNPYTQTGWSEPGVGNLFGSRRGVGSTDSSDFISGENKCLDLAFIFNNDTDSAFQNVDGLFNTADFIQNYYDTDLLACNEGLLKLEDTEQIDFNIYPNPASSSFTLSLSNLSDVRIYDLSGKEVHQEKACIGQHQINIALCSGIYLVEVSNQTGRALRK
jgi:hypothetical protein